MKRVNLHHLAKTCATSGTMGETLSNSREISDFVILWLLRDPVQSRYTIKRDILEREDTTIFPNMKGCPSDPKFGIIHQIRYFRKHL